MRTDEWLLEIFNLIEDSNPVNREELLLKWGDISAQLGFEVSFDYSSE